MGPRSVPLHVTYDGTNPQRTDQVPHAGIALLTHCRMHTEVAAAAAEQRPVQTTGWLEAVDEGMQVCLLSGAGSKRNTAATSQVAEGGCKMPWSDARLLPPFLQAPMARVAADLELSVLERRQMPLVGPILGSGWAQYCVHAQGSTGCCAQ